MPIRVVQRVILIVVFAATLYGAGGAVSSQTAAVSDKPKAIEFDACRTDDECVAALEPPCYNMYAAVNKLHLAEFEDVPRGPRMACPRFREVKPRVECVEQHCRRIEGRLHVSKKASLAAHRRYLAGLRAYSKRDFKRARREWNKCLNLDPENDNCQGSLARLESLNTKP